MQLSKWMMLLVLAAVVGLAGCRSAPVMNVQEAPVTVVDGKASQEEVAKAIIRAGQSLGWQIKKASPGKMNGTLMVREHMANIEIAYNAKQYSITYKDSKNLNYDGTNIHSNYNGWIQNLNNRIQFELNNI